MLVEVLPAITRISRSSALRGMANLASGSVAAQLVMVAVSPVLTRLYTPDDFGALAAYLAVTGFLIALATGRYELAIVLARSDREATVIASVALIVVFVTALLTAFASLITFAVGFAGGLGSWLLLVPITVLFGGMASIFRSHAVRNEEYSLIASSNVLRQLIAAATQVALGIVKFAPGGLLLGGFLGIASANIRLGRPVIAQVFSERPNFAQLQHTATEYSEFPKWSTPAAALSGAYLQGTPIAIGAMFGAATLGIWSLAWRVVLMPLNIIGTAVADVYYRQAVAARIRQSGAVRLFDKTVIGLCISFTPVFLVISIWGPEIFEIVFGRDWRVAGVYAQIMMPLVWARFATSPVARTFAAHRQMKYSLLLHCALLVSLVVAVAWSLTNGLSIEDFLALFSLMGAFCYIAALPVARFIVKNSEDEAQ